MKLRIKSTDFLLRTAQLNVQSSPKVAYLAKLAARYQGLSLADFIEDAVAQALLPERMKEDEPSPGREAQSPKAASPLWGEGLWDDDEATRMFMLAVSHPNLLNVPQTKLWTLLSGSILANGKNLNLNTFREYYYSPSINTSHLEKGNE